jgi:prepilin-type N-terminal cleavage/methylation domain-containing protein
MTRRGFTLVEMLVATIVFLVGFVAVFGLFLGAMRMRKLAEDTTRASLAASCIVDEIRANAGGGNTATPEAPEKYVGDGYAANGKEDGTSLADTMLFPYQPIPGTWYRVMRCTDLNGLDTGDPASHSTVLHLKLMVVPFATSASTLGLAELNRRLLNDVRPALATSDAVADELVKRGIGFQFQAVITRRPSWLP